MTELVHTYENPLSTLAVGVITCTTIIWQTKTGNKDLKDDLKEKAGSAEIKAMKGRLKLELDRVKVIAIGGAVATVESLKTREVVSRFGDVLSRLGLLRSGR